MAGAVIRARPHAASQPTTRPKAIPPTTSRTNSKAAAPGENAPLTDAATAKR